LNKSPYQRQELLNPVRKQVHSSQLVFAFELAALLVARCFPLNIQCISTVDTNNIDTMFLLDIS